MTDQQLIIAVAKLDGWTLFQDEKDAHLVSIYKDDKYCQTISKETAKNWHERKFNYLTSRDAIIPVIEKQPLEKQYYIFAVLATLMEDEPNKPIYLASARKYSIALVKATGNWEE